MKSVFVWCATAVSTVPLAVHAQPSIYSAPELLDDFARVFDVAPEGPGGEGPAVVGDRAVGLNFRGYVWTPGQGLFEPAGPGGSVVGRVCSIVDGDGFASPITGGIGYAAFGDAGAFLLTDAGSEAIDLPAAASGGDVRSLVVSGDGSALGVGVFVGNRLRLYFVDEASEQEIGSGDRGEITAIAQDGSAVAGFTGNGVFQGEWFWSPETGRESIAGVAEPGQAVALDGAVLVNNEIWLPGIGPVFQYQGFVFFNPGFALDSNARLTRTVGYVSESNGTRRAVVWDDDLIPHYLDDFAEDLTGLNLSGWVFTEADAISADGTIISGLGRDPQGRETRFVLDLRRSFLCADQNADGELSNNDFWTWYGNFSAGLPIADCNFDGVLSGSDFAAWNQLFMLGENGPTCLR